ncbi:MAG: TlpA family protein disulfide reductase [Flavobacteriales bacterium]
MINKLIWPIRVVFFLFFFLSAFSKIYPNPDVAIHLFEKEQLMSLHIPLCLSTWFSRLLIALEFTIALGFLIPFYFKRITLPLSSILLLLFSLFLAIEVFVLGKWTGNCGCFGQLIPMTPPISLVKNVVALIILAFVIWKRSELEETKEFPLVYYITAYAFIFLVIYLISPKTCICESNNSSMNKSTEMSAEVKLLKDKFPGIQEGKAILCFYSPTCPHCMETAKALQQLKKRTGVDKHFVVFMVEGATTEKKIQKFLSLTKLSATYTSMEFIDFPKDTGPPGILIVNNGKVEKRFFGNDKNKFTEGAFIKAFNAIQD